MNEIGRAVIFLGVVLILVGLFFIYFDKIPLVGKLPGDILIKKGHFTFYFPLASSIILSIIFSIIFYLIGRH